MRIFVFIIWMIVTICYASYSQGIVSNNKTMEFDTSTAKKPLIGIQIGALIPSIFALPPSNISRVEETSSPPQKIHTRVEVSIPKIHYTPGIFMKYKRHMALAGVIFRPHVSKIEGLIETHPNKYKFYNLKEYAFGGLFVQYGYQLFTKQFFQNYLSPGLFFYSYTTHDYYNPFWGWERVTVNSYVATVSNISQIKINNKIWLQIEPAIWLYYFHYKNSIFKEELKGIRTYFQLTGGIAFLINQ